MRRNFLLWCAAVDIDGKVSRYYPKFRPRRLVMPVDPNSIHDNIREPNQLNQRTLQQARLRRVNERRGAIQLAIVPQERSVGDAMRMMLETCEKNNYFHVDKDNNEIYSNTNKQHYSRDRNNKLSWNDKNYEINFIPRHMKVLHELIQACKEELLVDHSYKDASALTNARTNMESNNDEVNSSNKLVQDILNNSTNSNNDPSCKLSPFYKLALVQATQERSYFRKENVNHKFCYKLFCNNSENTLESSCSPSSSSSESSLSLSKSEREQEQEYHNKLIRRCEYLQQQEEEGKQQQELAIRKADQLWLLLDSTPLNCPVHGMLAKRGKALVERVICQLVYRYYPRLRSKHIQRILHQTCGLLPCGEIARRIGLTSVSNTDAEVQMWRELNTLTERLRVGEQMYNAHDERLSKGVAQQRRWYWRAVRKSARDRLHLYPVAKHDIQPRLEWIRQFLFAFIAFVEIAEQSGDASVQVQPLIYHLFCPQLKEYITRLALLSDARELLEYVTNDSHVSNKAVITANSEGYSHNNAANSLTTKDGNANNDVAPTHRRTMMTIESNLVERLRTELTRLENLSADEEEVLEGKVHPLNQMASIKKGKTESSAGQHAIEGLKDDLFSEYEVNRHRHQAPAILVHALQVQNALKEAQIILKYAPSVSPQLRSSPIDVDQVIHKVTEVHETNAYLKTTDKQQFRQVEYTVCRLYAGKHCLGEGKGETLMQSTQEAALQMVGNYYFKSSPESSSSSLLSSSEELSYTNQENASNKSNCTLSNEMHFENGNANRSFDNDDGENNVTMHEANESISEVRINPPRSQEEVAFEVIETKEYFSSKLFDK